MAHMTTKREQNEVTLGHVLTRYRDARYPSGVSAGAFKTDFDRAIAYLDVSGTTLANYHVAGQIKKPDVEIVEALVAFYGIPLAELPPDIARRVVELRDRLLKIVSGITTRFAPNRAHAA